MKRRVTNSAWVSLLLWTAFFLTRTIHASSSRAPLDLSYLHRTASQDLAAAIRETLQSSNSLSNGSADDLAASDSVIHIDLTSSLMGKDLSEILASFILLPPTTPTPQAQASSITKADEDDDDGSVPIPLPRLVRLGLTARRNQWTAQDATAIFNFLLQDDDDDDDEEEDNQAKTSDTIEASETTTTAELPANADEETNAESGLPTHVEPNPSPDLVSSMVRPPGHPHRRYRRPAFVSLDVGWNNFSAAQSDSPPSSSSSSSLPPSRRRRNAGKDMNLALQRLLADGRRCPQTLRLDVCALDPSTCRAVAKGLVDRYGNKNGCTDGNDGLSEDPSKDQQDGGGIRVRPPPCLSLHLARNEAIGDPGAAALAAAIRTVGSRLQQQRRQQQQQSPLDHLPPKSAGFDGSKISNPDTDLSTLVDPSSDETTVLDTLDLSGCGIGDVGAKALGIALEGHPLCVRCLDLSNNQISDEGVTSLARALSGDLDGGGRVETLDLSGNPRVGDRGAKALATALQAGGIQNLILRSCHLHADGAACFGRALRSMAASPTKSSSPSSSSGIRRVRIDLSGNPLGILRQKPKSESKYSATAFKSKATATTAAYINLIGRTVQKGLKDFGLTDGSIGGLDTLESDDEEEGKMGKADQDDNESKRTCGALAFAEAFIGEDDEQPLVNVPAVGHEILHVDIGLRYCSLDTRAAEALAAVLQESRRERMGMNLTLDLTMNHVLDEDMVAALHGKVGYEDQLTEMAETYLEALEVLRESQQRAAAAARAAAARMRAETEMEESWGSPVALRRRDNDDNWEDDAEDEWDSDAAYDFPEDDDDDDNNYL